MSREQRRVLLIASIALLGMASLVVFLFDPERWHFYPVCIFHEVTGWECPGCGGLRATHQLLCGHIAAAWRFNPLVTVLEPVVGWWVLREAIREFTGKELPFGQPKPALLWALAPAVILFGVLRNIH